MTWLTACELDSRASRAATGSETYEATTPAEGDSGAGGRIGAEALDAGVQPFVGGSTESGSTGRAGNDDGSADGTARGAGNAGSAAAGSSNGSALPGTPDDPSDPDPPRTGTGVGPARVFLGEAGSYAILAQSAITNVPFSVITGNLGISPAAASSITGFSLTRAGTLWLAPEVVGEIFAADNDPPTPNDLIGAVSDMQAAYDDAAGRTTPQFSDLGAGDIGGLTLAPGLYKWASVVNIPSDVTISGAANDVWIFQIAGDLTLASGRSMILSGGAQAKNIVWQVAGFVDLGTTSHAEGSMLSKTAIHLRKGASVGGRLLAQTAVTLDMATVTAPPP